MKVPSYVQYKNLPYILVESDGNMGKILDPGTQKKLHVNLSNLSPCGTKQPVQVETRFGNFFVTPKGTIVSTATLRTVYRNACLQRDTVLEAYNAVQESGMV